MVLVTGAKGFIGKRFLEMASASGLGAVAFEGDVRDPHSFQRFEGLGITAVLHCAAKTFVPESWDNPSVVYDVNVNGTLQALEFCRKNNAKMVYISTYVYGIPVYQPVDEAHPIEPVSPYNHSKYMADELCRRYHQYFKVPVAVLRPFNIYGPGQSGRFLIPSVIAQIEDPAAHEVVVATLVPRRDYLFLDDLVEAILAVLGAEWQNEVFNIGSGASHSVEEVVKACLKASGSHKTYRSLGQERPNEVMDLKANSDKLFEWTGFRAKVGLEEGIGRCFGQ